ncbi:MAG: hypothetical protein H7841_03065 [Magnetospirillum sp. WYHS-4]
MKRLFATFLLAVAVAPPAGAAGTGYCPPFLPGPPHVEFEANIPVQPAFDHRLSRAEIESRTSHGMGQGWRAGGLTTVAYETLVAVRVQTLGLPDGSRCVQVTGANGRLDVRDLTVHVAREHRPGTCPFAAIREHEMEHAAIARQTFLHHLPALRARLEEEARGLPPIRTAQPDEAVQAAVDRLLAALAPTLKIMETEMTLAHAGIDTPESYQALGRRCAIW